MKLLSATPSPFARKVRIALAEKGIPFELVTDMPWGGDTSVPSLNPLGKVPVLVLDDGKALFDSRFILEYLELKHPVPPLLPVDIDGRLAAKQVEVLADGVCDAVVLIVIEGLRPRERQSIDWMARQRRKINAGVAALAASLQGGPWALGDAFGLADIAIGSALGYVDLRLPETAWRPAHPGLVALAERLATRPSFRATTPYVQDIPSTVA
jgi:glutathione S-transferase